MTFQRQLLFWVGALFLLVLGLWLLRDILLPFLAGLVLAYLLDPVADALERLGLPRVAATLLILGATLLILVVGLMLLAPLLADQVARFAANLPETFTTLTARFNELAPQWFKDLLARSDTNVPASMTEMAGRAAGWIGTLLASILSGGLALINVLSLLVVTPIVAFYLLTDWDRLVARVDQWLPRQHVGTIRTIAHDIDSAMAGFVRGQGAVCLFLGLFYGLGLSLAGLNFGLLIGLGAGLLSFIPFVGSLTGGLVSVGMALAQFWPDWWAVVIVGGIFVTGQFIEGNFLSPKLVGDRVGLHPVWLMFALFAFGYVFGFVGLLLAVPLAAATGVLSRFALNKYLGSPLYHGTDAVAKPVMRKRR
ncbi:MAG: AI-2E family transporter [Pseudomonadota bacterium]|nr:AI-2E family transporter [Pseudomonadota bacterium]